MKNFKNSKKYSVSVLFLVLAAFISPVCLLYAAEKTVPAPRVEIGDKWVYTVKEGNDLKAAQKTRGEKRTYIAERITAKEIVFEVMWGQNSFGKATYDRQWNVISSPDSNPHNLWTYEPHSASFSFPLFEGKKWTAKYDVKTDVWEASYTADATVVGWEKVTVAAGTFDAIKIVTRVKWKGDRTDKTVEDTQLRTADVGGISKSTLKYYEGEGELTLWYVPEVNTYVKSIWDITEIPSNIPNYQQLMLKKLNVQIFELANYTMSEEAASEQEALINILKKKGVITIDDLNEEMKRMKKTPAK